MYAGDVENGLLVLIDWLDTSELQSWRYKDADLLKRLQPVAARTVGWVVRSDSTSIAVSQTIAETATEGEDQLLNAILTIPRGCITRLQQLSVLMD